MSDVNPSSGVQSSHAPAINFKASKWFEKEKNTLPPFTLAVFRTDTRQLLFGADANIDPISGSLSLDNGMYRGLHRQSWTLRDERRSGIDGGSFKAGVWIPRKLTAFDGLVGMGIALIGDDTLRMDPGTYNIDAEAPALGVGDHQVRWQNITDKTHAHPHSSTTECFGTSTSSCSDEQATVSKVRFRLHVNEKPQLYQLQHCCSGGRPVDGFGRACGFKDAMEVYSTVMISRVN
jgi:hypothetical protein